MGQFDLAKKTVNGKLLYFEKTKRVLYDTEKDEFYGILGENGKILPMTDDIAKWVESHGRVVRQEPGTKTQEKHKSRDKTVDVKPAPKNVKEPVKSATKNNTKDTKERSKIIASTPEAQLESIESAEITESLGADDETNASNTSEGGNLTEENDESTQDDVADELELSENGDSEEYAITDEDSA